MDFAPILFKDSQPKPGTSIAFFGGGGKTSLIRKLGFELSKNNSVLLTSLTKSGPHQGLEPIFLNRQTFDELKSQWPSNPLFLMGSQISAEKFGGIDESQLKQLIPLTDIALVENDGARNLPLKIHSETDPSVPDFVDIVLIVVGSDTVGQIPQNIVHRYEKFCEYWKVNSHIPLSAEFIAGVVTSKYGYLSKVKPGPEIRYFVNKADLNEAPAGTLARAIAERTEAPVFFGSVRDGWWKTV